MNRRALILSLLPFASYPAMAADLSWLPPTIHVQLDQISEKSSDRVRADLYLCHLFCEWIGEFHSKDDFRPRVEKGGLFKLNEEAKKPENSSYLRLVLNPQEIAQPEFLIQEHSPESIDPHPQLMNPRGQQPPVLATKGSETNSEGASSADTSSSDSGAPPLLLGAHLDAMFGSNSLSTTANTDVDSDFQTHPLVGGGLDFEARDLASAGSGSISANFDLSFWDALSPHSKVSDGEAWSSQIMRGEAGGIWQAKHSRWRFGLLLEGREEADTATPVTALAFSSSYLWASIGAHVQYRKTVLQVFRSLVGIVQDSDQYRGTQVSSTRTMLDLTSCKTLGSILGGEFDVCGDAEFSVVNVNGSGTPAQPVFTPNPTYNYSGWQGGVQLKIMGISL